MARSRKKTPIGGIGSAKNDKSLKDHSNGSLRTRERIELKKVLNGEIDPEDVNIPVNPQELTDPWSGAKDGKLYYGKLLDEDPEWGEKFMRK